jgi:hypothetical protein
MFELDPVTMTGLPTPSPDISPVEMRSFRIDEVANTSEFADVTAIANRLHVHLNSPDALRSIFAANRPGSSSQEIQGVFREFAHTLGFVDESRGLFDSYETSALRPDYFLRMKDTGILLEVERGKTTINNMDLMDFWKCHICTHAHYLFLLVPRALRQNETMSPRNEFASVAKRLSTFFQPHNHTNVRGLFLYGY